MSNPVTKSNPADPRTIFIVAEQFRRSAGVILRQLVPQPRASISMDGDNPYKMSPVIAMSAFSFELFLKCLIVLDGGKPPRSHDLGHLFEKLSKSRKDEIKRRCKKRKMTKRAIALSHRPGVRIEKLLEESSNAFESHRYIYEHERHEVSPYTVGGLANAVRDIILKIQPDWVD